MRKPAARFTAFLLLFLFLEKAGMRLWIHEYFHQGITVLASDNNEKRPDHPAQHLLAAGCDCMDDFFLPLTPTEEITFNTPYLTVGELTETGYKSFAFSSLHLINRHRGPPGAC